MQKLKDDLKNNKISGTYLFYGDEVYIRDIYLNKIKDSVISGDFGDMNFVLISGADTQISQIDDAVSTLPFMSDKRLIIVKDSGFFSPKNSSSVSSESTKKLAADISDIISAMPETSILIFAESTVDKRSAVYKSVSKKAHTVAFEMPPIREMPANVRRSFKNRGIEISPDTAEYLVNCTEYTMSAIESEISKLSAYAADKNKIDKSDIDLICTKTIESKIFTLLDNVVGGNSREALNMYRNMLANKESPMMILAMITRQFRNILRCASLKKAGKGIAEIAEITKQKEYPVKKCLEQSKRFKMWALVSAVKECYETDKKIKTGVLRDDMAVEMLIVKETLLNSR